VLFDDNHIQFKLSDSLVVTSKLIDGNFPDWRAIVPEQQSSIVLVEKVTLNLAMQRAMILSHEKYKGVALSIDENRMVISAHTQNEESENIISAEYAGEELEIGFNGVYILEAISTIDSDKIQLGLVDNKSSLMISDTVDSRFFSIIMPMRL
jgi:DNA polymerase-3 subunit beta